MSLDRNEVFAEVCTHLEPHNRQNITISDATDITVDLSIDSVAVMDLIMELEDHYDVTIPMNLLTDVRTVGQLIDTVLQVENA